MILVISTTRDFGLPLGRADLSTRSAGRRRTPCSSPRQTRARWPIPPSCPPSRPAQPDQRGCQTPTLCRDFLLKSRYTIYWKMYRYFYFKSIANLYITCSTQINDFFFCHFPIVRLWQNIKKIISQQIVLILSFHTLATLFSFSFIIHDVFCCPPIF